MTQTALSECGMVRWLFNPILVRCTLLKELPVQILIAFRIYDSKRNDLRYDKLKVPNFKVNGQLGPLLCVTQVSEWR